MEKEWKATEKKLKKRYNGFSWDASESKLWLQNTENVYVREGILQRGIGLRVLKNEYWNEIAHGGGLSEIDETFYVWDKDNGGDGEKSLAFLTEAGEFFLLDEQTGQFSKKKAFGGKMHAISAIGRVQGRTKYDTIFVGESGIYEYSRSGGLQSLSASGTLPLGCFCRGRVFYAVNGHTVAYTEAFAPENIEVGLDAGGSVTVPSYYGVLVGLERLFDRVYLFFERGIAYIDAAGDVRDMCVKQVAYGGGKIFARTICDVSVDGEKAFFLSQDGVYAISKTRVWKVAKNVRLQIDENSRCACAGVDGVYFAVYGVSGNRKAVAVNADDEKGFSCVPFVGVSACEGEGYCVYDGAWQRLALQGDLPSAYEYAARSAWTELGTDERKRLESLTVFGTGSCKLTVYSDEGEQSAEGAFTDGRWTLKIPVRGKRFAFRFVLREDCEIYGLETTVQYLQGEWV